MAKSKELKISVRNLVEFIYRGGDINSTGLGTRNPEAMQLGSKIHKKIQKSMGIGYRSEVPLFTYVTLASKENGEPFTLKVEGRADGIFQDDSEILVDEIKGVYLDIHQLKEPLLVHKAQAMCYAYMICEMENPAFISVQVTYCHLESEEIRRFKTTYSREEILSWFQNLIDLYTPWAQYEYDWQRKRNASIQSLTFPFAYREGQKELAACVYKTIEHKKKIFIQAPTGVGKTISTVFPSVKAMGEGLIDRIFYLTAKTITRTVAQECFQLLSKQNLSFKFLTITAKEKMCFLENGPECNPGTCPYAKGHYDRVNDCVYDMLIHENDMNRDTILSYAEKYTVCPFEMCLDAALFADSIICDYNYAFDPNVYLRRFFSEEHKGNFAFLIDEAHNLVERAREMYSAVLIKEDFLKVKRILNKESAKGYPAEIKYLFKIFVAALDRCNKTMLEWKHQCDYFELLDGISAFEFQLLRVINSFELLTKEVKELPERETILNLFFDIRHFVNMNDTKDEKYRIYTDYDETGNFRIKLQCMDPSTRLSDAQEQARSTIFFSATLLPMRYYMEQLSTSEEDYAIYAKSSFSAEQRRIIIANDVTSKYTRRTPAEYQRIAGYIREFVQAKQGNYIIFFPSYAFLNQVLGYLNFSSGEEILIQQQNMTESDKEEFLAAFDDQNDHTLVGLCVMGGIFSEGIDLKEDRLIGTAIVGTGLPQVCRERELFKQYYDEQNGRGFDYAYLYPGINKVFQAGGRVIRTATDRGIILLLDERFAGSGYRNLFPKEWHPYDITNKKGMKELLHSFWNDSTEPM
ncbi:MAG: helicase C-terminal domain-containing protein [Eubacterium sp.]|nr:helicase C-terminal domain-containing protein [Eubacterium sp.]